jgi:hypothetical protein
MELHLVKTKMEFAGNVQAAPPGLIDCHDGPAKMKMQDVEFDATKTTPWERAFNPYDFNGGYVFFLFLYQYCCIWLLFDIINQKLTFSFPLSTNSSSFL